MASKIFCECLKIDPISTQYFIFSLDFTVMERTMYAIYNDVLRSAVEVLRKFRAEFEFNNVPIPNKEPNRFVP